jgi:lysosomal acid lipase/cholesteryl ester hydrolase
MDYNNMIGKIALCACLMAVCCYAALTDVMKDFKDIVIARHLAVEEHTVLTDDGYILTLFRIPGPLGEIDAKKGPPVLLVHGLVDSSDGWIANDDNSPAFILSRAGYDVWLGNTRGNKYSKSHISMAIESEAFWDFTWEELGTHDLPAFTDYVLAQTGYDKLGYIGHSMGTTQAFYGLVHNLNYFKERFNLFVALAPPVSLIGMRNFPQLKFLTD